MKSASILTASAATIGMLLVGPASADDFTCNNETITGFVNGNLLVSGYCTITETAPDDTFVNGNVICTADATSVTVEKGARVNGNIEKCDGDVTVTVTGAETKVNGSIYYPYEVVCMDAYVNGNIDDMNDCAGVAPSCDVNGNICGVGADDEGTDG